LDENGYRLSWRRDQESGKEKFVIARPGENWPKMPRTIPDLIATRLAIDSKESWEAEKDAAGL
jgi:hypothetical protein